MLRKVIIFNVVLVLMLMSGLGTLVVSLGNSSVPLPAWIDWVIIPPPFLTMLGAGGALVSVVLLPTAFFTLIDEYAARRRSLRAARNQVPRSLE